MSDPLRLGLIPGAPGIDYEIKRSAFASALGLVVGARVEIHLAADYRVLVSAMEQNQVDFAWLPPLAAARALRTLALMPAAIAVRNGVTSYLTGLFSLRDSSIRALSDLQGVRAAWVDRESAAGYVVIRSALRKAGVNLVDAFAEEMFVRSHDGVARALRTKTADVGATCFNYVDGSLTLARGAYSDEGGLPSDAVRLLVEAGPIPSDIFAVHGRHPRSLVDGVQAALVDQDPPHVWQLAREIMHADRFVRPDAEHMRMLEGLFSSLRHPLSSPPFRAR